MVGPDPRRQPPLHGDNPTHSPIKRGRWRPYHALGRTLLEWHSDDILEGSFVVPATTYRPGITLEDDALLLLSLVQVSRLLPPGSVDPNTMD